MNYSRDSHVADLLGVGFSVELNKYFSSDCFSSLRILPVGPLCAVYLQEANHDIGDGRQQTYSKRQSIVRNKMVCEILRFCRFLPRRSSEAYSISQIKAGLEINSDTIFQALERYGSAGSLFLTVSGAQNNYAEIKDDKGHSRLRSLRNLVLDKRRQVALIDSTFTMLQSAGHDVLMRERTGGLQQSASAEFVIRPRTSEEFETVVSRAEQFCDRQGADVQCDVTGPWPAYGAFDFEKFLAMHRQAA
ncbi:MAG: hypothetical protein AAF720_01900 [Pseudomonadota bacterium]